MKRFALLHHKCGSVYTRKLLAFVCKHEGYELEEGSLGKPPMKKLGLKRALWERFSSAGRTAGPVILLDQTPRFAKLAALQDDFRAFHVIRDPRDAIVSGYFSHRYSHSVDNDWGESYLVERRAWLDSVSKDEGMLDEIRHGYALNAMKAWKFSDPRILEIRFEDLIEAPVAVLEKVFEHLELQVETSVIEESAERSSFKRLAEGRSEGEEDPRSHFRKGVPGDWKNHYNAEHIKVFKELWGPMLIDLGYEQDLNW